MRYLYLEFVIVPKPDGTWQAAESDDGGLPDLDPQSDTVWGYGNTPQTAIAALMIALHDEDWTVDESETTE